MHTDPHALDIVTRPDLYHDQPAILACAWAALKEARGQSVNFATLAAPAHIVQSPGACNFDLIRIRVARKVRAIAHARGYALPQEGGAA